MNINQNILKQMIFVGYCEQEFSFEEYTLKLCSLNKDDSDEIVEMSKFVRKKNDNYFLIIDLLSRSIKSINGMKFKRKDDIISVLLSSSSSFIFSLYECYKQLIDNLPDIIQENFDSFVESYDSKKRWELFKQGYKFEGQLSNIQESWIYWNIQNDKKESFDRQFNFAKYIVHKIGHAVVNPKDYVKKLRQENTHQTEQEQDLDLSNHHDLSKNIFEKLKDKKKESDSKGAKEIWDKAMSDKDNHDDFVREQEIIRFKNALRKRKLSKKTSKPTAVIKQKSNLNVGYKQEFSLENENAVKVNQNNPYVIEGISYKDILTSKAVTDIENKMEILQEVIKEENSEQFLEGEIKPNINSFGDSKKESDTQKIVEKHKHEDNLPKKTLRELMFEKGINVNELNKMKINELKEELKGDTAY